MARYLICTDIHWAEFASIVRSFGTKYSTRLERCIASINWFESLALSQKCDAEFFLGDFFDQSALNAAEISALGEIHWNALPKYFLVGNHEASDKSLFYNSANALSLSKEFEIINKPTLKKTSQANLLFIPYYIDSELKSISDYWNEVDYDATLPRIVLSHNSVKGLFYGKVPSTEGFELSDIENNCELFLNGHLHNGGKICSNGLNLGNFVGQNFSENAQLYTHCAYVLDTETNQIDTIENPEAFNFYQFKILDNNLSVLQSCKPNSVVTIQCPVDFMEEARQVVATYPNITHSRITALPQEIPLENTEDIKTLQMNHLDEFVTFCKTRLDNTSFLLEELSKICEV